MKLTIAGFNHEQLLKIQRNDNPLEVRDLVILEYLADLQNRGSLPTYFINNEIFNLITHQMVSEDLEFLRISKGYLMKVLERLASYNLIKLHLEKHPGTALLTFVRISDAYEALLYDMEATNI